MSTRSKSFRSDVFIHVQHLLGIGHLRRAAAIARSLAKAGLRTLLVSGGRPLPELDLGGASFHQLPPLASRDERFTALVDENGRIADDTFKARRRAQLLELFRDARPKLLLLEQYPFGRRQLRFELEPLVLAAKAQSPRPLIATSLRDILNPVSCESEAGAAKIAWMLERAEADLDFVLVHGEPAVAPLEASLPGAERLAPKLRYTGYIAEAVPAISRSVRGEGEVLVSCGGGAVAGPLIAAALAARPQSSLATAPWRILVGRGFPEVRFAALVSSAPPGVTVEWSRPDFPGLLARARLSISQAGYNTLVDVLLSGAPAVVVPFEGAGAEGEQLLRARLFAARGFLACVREGELSGSRLAAAIEAALALPREGRAVDMSGLQKTGAIVRDSLAKLAAQRR